MQTIAVIDYGGGNVASVMKALDYAGADVALVSDADKLGDYDKIVLPGVGASKATLQSLRAAGFDQALEDHVRSGGTPFMGICVGMQVLAQHLHEYGSHDGLGWIEGDVVHIKDHAPDNTVPHMGWSDVTFGEDLKDLSSRLGRHKAFYFCHSYMLTTPQADCVQATAEFGNTITAGIAIDNIYAFQFHPEKSQVAGDLLMQWFVDL